MLKEMVATEVARRVKDGDVIGVGTGSTVEAALTAIGRRVSAEGLRVRVVPTSYQSAWTCERMGLETLFPGSMQELSWGFDGADAIDDRLRVIKGKGGAMLKEKILAARCRRYLIIADESKYVENIAAQAAIPVEVIPEALAIALSALPKLGAREARLRLAVAKYGPVITEAGNLIVDARFDEIAPSLESDIKSITGVVESGLFLRYVGGALIGTAQGVKEISAG